MKRLRKFFYLFPVLLGIYLLLAAAELDQRIFVLVNTHAEALQAWVAAHQLLAALAMVALYITLLSLSFPVGIILAVVAGFLFGTLLGTLLIWLSAIISAWLVFRMARGLLYGRIQRHFKAPIRRLKPEFEENGIYYLLALRLSYILPFFLVNLTLGSLPIKARLYLITTTIGLLPGTLLYAWLGQSLSEIERFGDLLTARIFLIFLLIGALALLPVVIKKYRKKS